MARGDTYTQQYSNFIGADMSSDPREVSRNRLAYSVNMWRDYESEQGAAIETFPGFRRVADGMGAIHGIYGYRDNKGKDYVIVHGGTDLYYYDYEDDSTTKILEGKLADSDSTGFLFNNKLYIQDGTNYIAVSGVVSGDAVSVTADEVEAYIPTTYYDGKPYEQRNMLVDEAYEKTSAAKMDTMYRGRAWYELFVRNDSDGATNGFVTRPNYSIKTPYVYTGAKKSESTSLVFGTSSFENESIVKVVDATSYNDTAILHAKCFKGCANLESVTICIEHDENGSCYIYIDEEAFQNCPKLETIIINISQGGFAANFGAGVPEFVSNWTELSDVTISDSSGGLANIPKGVKILIHQTSGASKIEDFVPRNKVVATYDSAINVKEVRRSYDNALVEFEISSELVTVNNEDFWRIKEVRVSEESLQYKLEGASSESEPLVSDVKVFYDLSPLHFSTIENVSNFYEGNTDYRKTGVEAIRGCTKSAVYDGRIFLTGNADLPNTVFYTQRNITGANDPTYFGAYNYMNDGDGNSPNVDLLSTPSMLMVLKNNTVQDGSVYYHVATDNASEDQTARNLLPRIYPSTSGVAGLGCAGKTVPGSVACNFLDDPVFLSTRGLEAVGKQTVNLERTITHRSGNVDRLLIKEDLSSASLAEWKGYLVICCNGHVYLADSRVVTQHEDGSYQYEWYYLEGIGCWESKLPRYRYLTYWANDEDGVSIGDYTKGGKTARETLKIHDERYVRHNGDLDAGANITADGGWLCGDNSKTLYYDDEGYLVEQVDDELYGAGTFYGAKKVFASGDLLFFGTDGGELLLVNTDRRGVPDYEGQILERDKISRQWYTFDGVAYESLCSLRLDDCGKKALAKNTVSGTTVARFKMMPGASCQVMVSLNGRDWNPLGRAVASRYDANDFDFETFAFAENEDEVAVLPELTRNWVMKQYLFKSGGFKRPFGLYELSYLYYAKGKIRR